MRKTFTYRGKRYYVRGNTLEEVIEKMTRLKVELEQGNLTVNSNTKVAVWCDKWLVGVKQDKVSAEWYRELDKIAKSIIVPSIGTLTVAEVKPLHVRGILTHYKGYSRSYQKKILNVLNGMFDEARRNDMITKNPCVDIDLPQAKPPTKRRSITDTEREHILSVAEYHHGGLFVKIMLYCGLRPSEVARLQWKDFKNGKLHITKSKTRAGIRAVPVPEVLELAGGDPFQFICTNENQNPMTQKNIENMWKSFKRELNISMGCKTYQNALVPPFPLASDLTLYCLRHTYCTDLQKAGVPITTAMYLMGHSNISITAEIYTHQDEATIDSALDSKNRYHVPNGVPKNHVSVANTEKV